MTRVLLLLSFVLFSSLAFAQKGGNNKKFQFRVGLGQLVNTPSSFNEQMETLMADHPALKAVNAANIDFMYILDSALLLGVRYDILKQEGRFERAGALNAGVKGVDTTLSGSRFDALIGWRPLRFSKGYLGLISHVSMGGGKLDYDVKTTLGNGTIQESKYTGKPEQGYGIGIEGAYLADDLYPVGLEVGYTAWSAKSFTDSSGANAVDGAGKNLEVDLSGLYIKFFVSFAF